MADDLRHFLALARAHGETSDTRGWIGDLESMLDVAWGLMTEEQREQFRRHPEILALVEAAGEA